MSGLGILTLLLLNGCTKSGEPHPTDPAPKVVRAETMTVTATARSEKSVVSGTIRPVLNSTLSSKVMGRVVGVFVREGNMVHTGDLLATIDSRELEAAASVASANYNASVVGVASAQSSVEIEQKMSQARIGQAESQVQQADAALAAAKARLDLAVAGPRTQEVTQSHLAVVQAESAMKLAKRELDRKAKLVAVGAIAGRELDFAQSQFDVAKAQFDTAIQSESIAKEGTRTQDIQSAQQGVALASGVVKQSKAGLALARAEALQIDLRRKGVEVADAQVKQTSAVLASAKVSLSYGQVRAPFDGRITQRLVDPGAMAGPGIGLLSLEGGGFRLEAVVPESIMKSVIIGDRVPVVIQSLGGKSIEGQIAEITPQGDAASHSYLVKISFRPVARLRTSLFGTAAIKTGVTQGIHIPVSSTWEREGLHYVFAVDTAGIARLRIITLGDKDGNQVPVLSGLNPGEQIVIGNRDAVTDGVKVEARSL